ncbi:MAG: restriction endonuclease [Candidatus Saccharibacteria bacterium]
METRQVWFITRPERDPKFHREALVALSNATNSFTAQWTGNRDLHRHYEKKLVEIGLKRDNISLDGSGGRTWAAMMKTFSYCYIDDDGYLRPTKVGEQIINGNKVYENVRKQILCLQIPNAYFLEAGFRPKFHSEFAVRPIQFLIRLCSRPDLDYYITKEEITFCAMTARTDRDIDAAAERIVQFRRISQAERNEFKSLTADQYEHRGRTDSAARSFETAHSDVAHTFMLLSDFTGMVEYVRGRALRADPKKAESVLDELDQLNVRYPFNKRYQISLIRMAENSGLDVDSYKARPLKSTAPATNQIKMDAKKRRLLKDYPYPEDKTVEELTKIFMQELPQREAQEAAFAIKQGASLPFLDSDFVEGYLNETNNTTFEDKTIELLKLIGFDVERHPRADGVNEEIEILVKYGDNLCGIIDCKNYREKFQLSSTLSALMHSVYIPAYDGFDDRKIGFFGYITASSFSGEGSLEKISSRSEPILGRRVRGFMMDARTLLGYIDFCLENDIPKERRVLGFITAINNIGYNSTEKFIRASDVLQV